MVSVYTKKLLNRNFLFSILFLKMMVVMVDKMLKTQIVECASVAKWIFSEDMKQELSCFYVWEILHATISRMSKQVDKVKHEYVLLNEKFNKSALDSEVSF